MVKRVQGEVPYVPLNLNSPLSDQRTVTRLSAMYSFLCLINNKVHVSWTSSPDKHVDAPRKAGYAPKNTLKLVLRELLHLPGRRLAKLKEVPKDFGVGADTLV